MFFIGQLFEAIERLIQFRVARELDAQSNHTFPECIPTRMFSKHNLIGAPADVLGTHDLVGITLFQHAILMYPGLVSECVSTNDRLVWLHRETCDTGNQTTGSKNVGGIEPAVTGEKILTGAHGHYDLLKGGVPGALAEPIDRTFNLPGPGLNRGQGIRNRDTQIVMTVHRKDYLIGVRNPVHQSCEHLAELLRHGVADCVGNVYGTRTSIDHGLKYSAKKILIRSTSIFC